VAAETGGLHVEGFGRVVIGVGPYYVDLPLACFKRSQHINNKRKFNMSNGRVRIVDVARALADLESDVSQIRVQFYVVAVATVCLVGWVVSGLFF
jgi:hypothetical protein